MTNVVRMGEEREGKGGKERRSEEKGEGLDWSGK